MGLTVKVRCLDCRGSSCVFRVGSEYSPRTGLEYGKGNQALEIKICKRNDKGEIRNEEHGE